MKDVFMDESRNFGSTITETKKGYVVESWSVLEGSWRGRKVLLLFDDEIVPGMDMDGKWNFTTNNRTALIHFALSPSCDLRHNTRVIRKGHKFQ